MKHLFLVLIMLTSYVDAKTFSTSYIELPTAYGTKKIASGLIYILKGSEEVLTQSFGYADYLEQTPFTPTTQIYIGSLKKQFVAAAILKLMSEGKLNLHAPISTYLKFNTDIPTQDPAWITNTTLHHLLTHVSNVKSKLTSLTSFGAALSYLDRVYVYSQSPSSPLQYTYNSAAYALLEMVIESVSGMPVSEYITHHFIVPFGMKDTAFHGPDIPQNVRQNLGNKLCYPYHFLPNRNQVVSTYNPHKARAFGIADMISTAEDLYKWNKALHSGRAFNTSPATANRLLQIMRGLYTVDDEGDSYYGYGIKTCMRDSKSIYWHEGLVTGASVYLEYDPETDTHLVIFSNNTGITFNSKTGTYILNTINDVF
jgi:CubicO group peptidase (beta-lactamase class C family)